MEVLFAIFLFLVLPIVIVVYLVARSSNAKPRSGATFDFDDPPDRRQRTPPRSVSTSPPARHGVFEISVEVVGPGSVRGYRPGAKRDARWLRQGEAISIAGYQITGGMLYVGEALDSVAGYSPEPALIVPSQPVARAHPDRQGQGMSYWPSYSGIEPRCRAAYLEWLATGRRDPDAYIGYVFLFFYGLERRALHETSEARPRSR